jgi:hypothetical protein
MEFPIHINRSTAMKTRFPTLMAGSLLLAWTAATIAGDMTIYGNGRAKAASGEDAATNACFEAFIKQLIPGSNVKVRTVNLATNQVFDSASLIDQMDVTMSARSGLTGKELASSRCTVTRGAKVISLYTHVTQPAGLAGLSPRDIKLAMTGS